MRKRIIIPANQETVRPDMEWLNLEELAEIEIPRRTPLIQLSLRFCPIKSRGGVLRNQESRPSDWSSTNHKRFSGSGCTLWIPKLNARKSMSCAGRPMVGSRFEKSCGNSGTSVRKVQPVRQRNSVSR